MQMVDENFKYPLDDYIPYFHSVFLWMSLYQDLRCFSEMVKRWRNLTDFLVAFHSPFIICCIFLLFIKTYYVMYLLREISTVLFLKKLIQGLSLYKTAGITTPTTQDGISPFRKHCVQAGLNMCMNTCQTNSTER